MNSRFSSEAFRHFFLWGVLSSLGVTVSTFVDAVFIGNFVGSDGLAVANIATPVFLFYMLMGTCIGLGSLVIIGKKLGSSDIDEANRIFSIQMTLSIAVGVVIAVLCVIFREQLIVLLGGGGALAEQESQYLTVVFASAPIFIVYQSLANAVRTDSDPIRISVSSAVVIIVNLSLDIVLMKPMGLGVFGASCSLCIAEALGIVVLLTHFRSENSLLKFSITKPHIKDIGTIISNGFGVSSIYLFQALFMVVFNQLLVNADGDYGVLNVALFGIIYTMSTVSCALFDGCANATSPVVSIFMGEKDKNSVLSVRKTAITTALISGLAVSVPFILLAKQIISFFGIDNAEYITTYGTLTFRLFAISLIFYGINTVCVSFWQSIGRNKLAGIMSIVRNLLLMLTVGIALITKFGVKALGYTYILCEVICLIITLIIVKIKSSTKYVSNICKPANRLFEKNYTVSTDSIETISTDICGICDEWEIDPKRSMFMNLVVEELILNIVKMGITDKKNKKEYYVDIKIMDNIDEYCVRIRDNVNSYNPFESKGDFVDNAVINMIKKKTLYYNYQRKLKFNYLYFVM